MPPATEPVKRLGDIVKVEEIPRPESAASTAFDSRPGSAVRPGSAMSWENGRPQSARRPYPPLSRPTSAVVRPSRPSSARPQSTLPAVSPSVTSEDTGTRSSQDPRPHQREEPTGDTLNDLEQEVAKINSAQPRSSPSHPRDGRPRRTSRTSVNSTVSDHYEYEGRDIAAGSPNLSEAGNEPDSRPVGPLARVLSDMEEDGEGEAVEEPPAQQQGSKLGEFSVITIRRLFDELDTERKGFVTRRELLFALNSREDLYQQFCYFYLQSAEQDGPEDLDRLQAADLPVVDDWLSAHRAANIQRTEWETQAHSYVFEETPTKQVRGRKSLIFRRSLEFLDEAYKQVCLLRAPTQVGSSQRLYQKCYNITLEILIHYFRMQGLLLEYQTAPILNLLPEDRTVWVDQVPPVFQALQASRGGATTAEVLGEFSSEDCYGHECPFFGGMSGQRCANEADFADESWQDKELLLDDCPAMPNPNPLHGAVSALQARRCNFRSDVEPLQIWGLTFVHKTSIIAFCHLVGITGEVLLNQASKHEAAADSSKRCRLSILLCRIDPFVDARDATEVCGLASAEDLWDSLASGKAAKGPWVLFICIALKLSTHRKTWIPGPCHAEGEAKKPSCRRAQAPKLELLSAFRLAMEVSATVANLMQQINQLEDADFQNICGLIDKAREERLTPTVLVTVRQLGGEHLLGPQLMPLSTTTLKLKGLLSTSIGARVEEMDLLCGTAVLEPTDTLASLGDHFQGNLDLIRRAERMRIAKHRIPGVFIATSCENNRVLVVPGAKAWDQEHLHQPDVASQDTLKQLQISDATFRTWSPFRSHIAAAIVCGISKTPKWKGERLFAVNMSAAELSFLADLVGEGGAVIYSPEVDVECASKLKEHWPQTHLTEGSSTERFHSMLLRGSVELHQTHLDRMTSLLLPGAVVMWVVELDGKPVVPTAEFARTVGIIRQSGLKPLEQLTLEPYFEKSAVIVSTTGRNWPECPYRSGQILSQRKDGHSLQFLACTMPPAKSREQEVIWYAFRAFDGQDEKEVTVEKVLQAARLLEGKLQASEQIAELLSVLQAELQRLRVPMRRERIEEAEDEDPDAQLRVEGEEEEGEAEWAHMPSQASQEMTSTLKSMSANVSFKESRRNQHGSKSKKGSWLQRKGQAMIEHARRWVTRPRLLDYGELVYLCDTRRKGVGPGKILYRAARKEFFRVMLKYDLDFYEVVHKVPELAWPPEAGAAASTPWSCYCATGGLYSSKQQKLQEKEKVDKKEKAARERDDSSDASSEEDCAGSDILPQEAEVKMLRVLLARFINARGEELSGIMQAMPKEEPSQDDMYKHLQHPIRPTAEVALGLGCCSMKQRLVQKDVYEMSWSMPISDAGCFRRDCSPGVFPGSSAAWGTPFQEEVAVKHRALFFPEGQEPLSRDHEANKSCAAALESIRRSRNAKAKKSLEIREPLVFLLDKLSTSGEKGSGAWRAFIGTETAVYAAKVQQDVNNYDVQDSSLRIKIMSDLRKLRHFDAPSWAELIGLLERLLKFWQFDTKIEEALCNSPDSSVQTVLVDTRRSAEVPYADDFSRWAPGAAAHQHGVIHRQSLCQLHAVVIRAAGSLYALALLDFGSDGTGAGAWSWAEWILGLRPCAALSSTVLPRLLGEASQQELVNIAFALVVGPCDPGIADSSNLQQDILLCSVQTEAEALDLPEGELLSFALQRLVKQVRGLEPISIHALRIIAHCVGIPGYSYSGPRSGSASCSFHRRCVRKCVLLWRSFRTVSLRMGAACRTTKSDAVASEHCERSPPMSSRLQAALERYFEELQVPHLPEQAVGPYVPDFVLPMKVVVEVDGYTHFYAFSQRMTARLPGVVSLPHFQWLPMNHQERLVFLSNKISVAAGQPFSAGLQVCLQSDACSMSRQQRFAQDAAAQAQVRNVEYSTAKGAVVDGEDPDLDQVKEGSLVRVDKVLEVAPNQINALLGNQQAVSLFLASPSASRFEEGDEEEDDALSPGAPPLLEDLEPGSEAVPEPGENDSPELPEVLAAEDKEETDPLKEAVVLPLPTIEIQPEPVSPTSEAPAPSEAATSEAKPKKEKPSEYYAGIVTPSSRSRSEAEMTPVKRMKPKSQVQYHPLRHDGTDGPREVFQPLVQTVQERSGMPEEAAEAVAEGRPSETMRQAETPMEDAAHAALPPEVAEGEPDADRGEEDADAKSIASASFDLGIVYVLRLPAFVAPSADVFEPDDDELIAELEEGEEIELVEILAFPEEGRVRGKLKSPEGWITLRNSATGTNWVAGYSDRGASDQVSQESRQVSEDPTAPYKKGVYILVRAAYVAHDADNFAPDDDELVARVEEGEEVEVVEVVDFVEEDRVRGRILEPSGWITLLNRITGTEWITPKAGGHWETDLILLTMAFEVLGQFCVQPGKPLVAVTDVNSLFPSVLIPCIVCRRKASELEQELGVLESLRALIEEPYETGIYLLVRSAFVAYDADNFTPDDDELVAELEEGEEVEVVEVIDFVEDDRVRGRLHDPDGWITLMNRATGAKWVTPKESGNDFRGASKTAASEPGEQEEGSHSEDEDGNEPSRRQRVADEEDKSPAMKWTSPEDAASVDAEAEGERKASGSQGAEEDPVPFETGFYVLVRTAFVALDADNFSPDDEELVAELGEGEEVEVVEVVDFVEEERVRGRLRDFDGWITLLNRATGTEWVAPTSPAQVPRSQHA
ncbi:NOP1 [Symbiodinium sp. CCMP2456]|nr:NOP1 [Symbiodinium sp. CCMP2456]